MSLYSALSGVGNAISDKLDKAGSDAKGNILDGLGGVAKGYFLIPSYLTGLMMDEADFTKAMGSAQKQILAAAEKRLNEDITNTSSATSHKASDYDGSDFFTYEVQYNPATITIRTMSGSHRQKKPGIGGETHYEDVPLNTFTELSVTLIFEAINNSDAFVSATDSISITGGAFSAGNSMYNKVANAIDDASPDGNEDKKLGKEMYSVRRNVQGFLALMTRTGWRNLTFFYGRMSFHGMITSVTPKYKMFNKSGEPILAEVELCIRQGLDSEFDNKIWEDSFLKCVDYQN